MKKEIELRLLNIDEEKFVKTIEDLKAEKIGTYLQRRYVYDFNPVEKTSG